MPTFTITHRTTGKKEVIKINRDSIIVGRDHDVDLFLQSTTVSRHHAELIKIDRDYFLVDLNSGNGTALNGRVIKSGEKNILKESDLIRIEDYEIKLSFDTHRLIEDDEENTDSGIIEIKMIKKVLSVLDADKLPSFEVVSPTALKTKINFSEDMQEFIIGRDKNCQLSIASDVVSRKHCVCEKKWGGITMRDLNSKNGTLVNNTTIEEKLLKDTDMITLGDIKIIFRNPQEIDIEKLSEVYEEKNKPNTETPKQDISQQAKLSIEPKKDDTSLKSPAGATDNSPGQRPGKNVNIEKTDHEIKKKDVLPKAEKQPPVSAKTKKKTDSDDVKKKNDSIKSQKPTIKKRKSYFTNLELLFMLGGIGILVIALMALYTIFS